MISDPAPAQAAARSLKASSPDGKEPGGGQGTGPPLAVWGGLSPRTTELHICLIYIKKRIWARVGGLCRYAPKEMQVVSSMDGLLPKLRKTAPALLLIVTLAFLLTFSLLAGKRPAEVSAGADQTAAKEDYIRYVEFNVTYPALEKAMKLDIASREEDVQLDWVEILAYLGAKYGGDFDRYKAKDMDAVVEQLRTGKTMEEIAGGMQYYAYYREAYSAVLDEYLGEYSVQVPSEEDPEKLVWQSRYGMKVFSPIAKTFPFEHYDDFGASRSYGYRRQHLGHDLMAATGTPVIAVESGVVEVMGWNQYGGWRVGIRSFDKKRYYYYAHLRQNRPFHVDLCEGKVVKAGDVIGYVGRTGYSTKENVNNIETSHLHIGVQLIFDESQKESDNEIWISLDELTKLWQKNKSDVYRVAETKEFYRQYDFKEPLLTGS